MTKAALFLALSLASSGAVANADAPAVVRGEVIIIKDRPKPAVNPKPKNWSPERTPPYSERAVLSDVWTKAHLLLDINDQGRVTRYKWLKRPGFDLEPIAVEQIEALRFDPAQDAAGRLVSSYNTWEIEWPSGGWLDRFVGSRLRMPPLTGVPARRLDSGVPCAGGGQPMNLDSLYPVLRDCSQPDLSVAASEAWIGVGTEPRKSAR